MDCRQCHLPESRFMFNLLLFASYLLWIITNRAFNDDIQFVTLESQWAPRQQMAKWSSIVHYE